MNRDVGYAGNAGKKIFTQPAGLLLNRLGLVAIAVLLVMAAWAGQVMIVILLSLALSAAGLSKIWSWMSLKGVHGERQMSQLRAFPDEHLEIKIRISNRKLLPLPWIQVTDEVPAGFATDFPAQPGSRPGFVKLAFSSPMTGYSALNWKYSLFCHKRGYYPLGPLTLASGDIFGFYPRQAAYPPADPIIVYPRIYTLAQLGIPSLYPLGETRSEKRIFEDPSRTIGVRDYHPGDSLRRIHWKASARHQQLQVKIYEPATTLKVGLFLAVDSFQNQGICVENVLELGINAAASVANYLIEKNNQAGLWINSKLADSGHAARILPRGGVEQLVSILEALAKVTPYSSSDFIEFFQSERQALPMGITLVFILFQLSDEIKSILTDLKTDGYKIFVLQVGETKVESIMPDFAQYNIQSPMNLTGLLSGEIA